MKDHASSAPRFDARALHFRGTPARPDGARDWRAAVPPTRLLWFAFAGTPIVWALNLILGYAVQATVCNAGGTSATVLGMETARAIPVLLSIVSAVIGFAGVTVAYRCWRWTGTGEENPEAMVPGAVGRSWFMSYAGLLSSMIFLLGILLVGISELVLGPCWSF